MKQFLIAGNWKMNTDINSTSDLLESIWNLKKNYSNSVQVLVCPPFTNLSQANKTLQDKPIHLGAQNCYWEPKGAFTGEISLDMIKSCGCNYVIIGHSERRSLFGETNQMINNKLHAILSSGLIPIVCIGETLEERREGRTFVVLEEQIVNSLEGIDEKIQDIVVAYEPVWAIGTGVAATEEQVDEAHNKLREMLNNKFGSTANKTLILYGGSVTSENADSIFKLTNVNGALIGGASLKAETFVTIINTAEKYV